MFTSSQTRTILITIAVLIMIMIGYSVMTTPDQRDVGQKIDDAIDELPNGIDKAARELEDRTPAEKMEDAAGDIKEDIQNSTNPD